jgi:hypothetical protein
LAQYEELKKQQMVEMPSGMNVEDEDNLDDEIDRLFETQDKIFI